MKKYWFPLQGDWGKPPVLPFIPWSIAEKAYAVYEAKFGTYQSLERLAERAGFAVSEMDLFYPAWRQELNDLILRK